MHFLLYSDSMLLFETVFFVVASYAPPNLRVKRGVGSNLTG